MIVGSMRYLALALVALTITPGASLAVQLINSCPATCSADCQLHSDISCTSGNHITLDNGSDLDMDGHSITCTSGSCTGAAVTMSANNSQVTNSLGGTFEAVIAGPWEKGVACGTHTGSKVIGIAIEDITGFGIYNCAQASGNRLQGTSTSSGVGIIAVGGTANSDTFNNNHISNINIGVELSSVTFGISVDHNAFSLASTGGLAIFLSNTSASSIGIHDNIIFGDAGVSPIQVSGTAPPSSVWAQNFCDPTSAECAYCISLGYCADPIAPFALP